MSAAKGLPFKASGFFALRTPLLSFNEILQWATAGDDEVALRRHLESVVRRPEVREAIFLASPKLESQIDGWLAADEESRDEKVQRALIRYILRMSARPTPFGTFAGTTVGTIGDHTELRLSAPASHRRKTRLDMHYLAALAETLQEPNSVRSLTWWPNSSLYSAAGRLRFAEARLEEGIRRYRLVAVESTEGVVTVLDRARGGASFDALADALIDDDITRGDAEAFVVRLIDSQLLVSDLEPPVTGTEALDSILRTLARSAEENRVGAVLEQTRSALDKIDAAGLGGPPQGYRALTETLRELPAEVDPSRLFQVDLVPTVERAELGRDVVTEVGRAIEALRRLTPAAEGDALSRFRADFAERYETREVSLVEALDEEIGIGFEASRSPTAEASPLLAGLPFDSAEPRGSMPSKRHDLLLRKLEAAWTTGAREIELDAAAQEALAPAHAVELPDAFAALCSIAAGGTGPIACLHGASGPSGAILLGRFCLADPDLEAEVARHLSSEEQLRPDAIFAEIVHLPEGRVGNILARPVLRPYEIPFLGKSGAKPSAQIPVTDLMVSVTGDRIVLRSRALDKEVLPRLTSAHNYTFRSLGVYRFLCALQGQSVAAGVVWRWGSLESARFLPRLVIGRVVVSRARWLIDGDDLEAITASEGERNLEAIQDLRARLDLPRYIALQDADNELVVDLDNRLAVDTFVNLVRRRPYAQVVEMWPQPDRLCVEGPGGAFASEVIVPFVRGLRSEPLPSISHPSVPRSARRFPPGSEWFYVKLYTGTATADKLIRELVSPFVRDDAVRGLVKSWFFIRYGDPHWHIRLRLHGDPDRLQTEALPLLEERVRPYFDDGSLWRMQLDTYEREVERYGGPAATEIAEEIFHIDSEAVLGLLSLLPGDAWMDARWRLTLAGIDMLLTDLGLDFDQRRRMAKNLRDGFAAEFDASVELKRGIGQRFRGIRKTLDEMMDGGSPSGVPLEGLSILEERSRSLQAPATALQELASAEALSLPHPEVVASIAHMFTNRLLRSAHRAHEMVIYDLLARVYDARAAKGGRA